MKSEFVQFLFSENRIMKLKVLWMRFVRVRRCFHLHFMVLLWLKLMVFLLNGFSSKIELFMLMLGISLKIIFLEQVKKIKNHYIWI